MITHFTSGCFSNIYAEPDDGPVSTWGFITADPHTPARNFKLPAARLLMLPSDVHVDIRLLQLQLQTDMWLLLPSACWFEFCGDPRVAGSCGRERDTAAALSQRIP
jgi:hypothetical protein